MRLACELILIVGLIALGWQKSFKQWTEEWRGARKAETISVRQTTAVNTGPHQPFLNASYARNVPPRPQSTISNGEWMWQHRSAFDPPGSDKSISPGYYRDEMGRKYWIDNRGYRHYEGAGSTP